MGKFPIPEENFLHTTARLLASEGARSEVALLASSPVELELDEYDNWDGGQYAWAVRLSMPIQTYATVSEEDRKIMAERIRGAMNQILAVHDRHDVNRVLIGIGVQKADPDWRDKAKRWAEGEGVNNQGRVRSTNIAPFELEGLLFRSRPEIYLFTALRSLGVTLAPLPVFVRGGQKHQRIEPDFVLVHANTMMVVEVDGERFHTESPVEAHERLTLLSWEGVKTERVRATDCDTPEKARSCAQKLFDTLKRYAGMRQ